MIYNSTKYNMSWDTKRIDELGEFSRGKSKHRPRNDKKLFEGGGFPLIQTGEVKSSNLYVNQHFTEYNDFGLKQSKLWPTNTLCITIAANIAESALLKYPMCFPDSVVGFEAFENVCSNEFMHYVFEYIKSSVKSSISGSIQDNINIDYLKNLTLKIPNKLMQDNILKFLLPIDKKIDLNDNIQKKIYSILNKEFEYAFANKLQNKNGIIKDVANIGSGYSFDSNSYVKNGNYKIITIKNVNGIFVDEDECDTINVIPDDIKKFQVLSKGNMLISLTGITGRISIVVNNYQLLNQRVGIINLNNDLYREYLYLLLNTKYYQKKITNISTGGNQKNLSPLELAQLECYIPSESEIIKFNKNTKKLFDLIIKIGEENNKLISLKNKILPLLMNGQIKIED